MKILLVPALLFLLTACSAGKQNGAESTADSASEEQEVTSKVGEEMTGDISSASEVLFFTVDKKAESGNMVLDYVVTDSAELAGVTLDSLKAHIFRKTSYADSEDAVKGFFVPDYILRFSPADQEATYLMIGKTTNEVIFVNEKDKRRFPLRDSSVMIRLTALLQKE